MEMSKEQMQSMDLSQGLPAVAVLKNVDKDLAKKACAVQVDGKIYDLTYIPKPGEELIFLSFEDEGGAHAFHHSSSHIMAQAIQHLFPDTKFGIGPAIKDGFYYDLDSEHSFSEDDFPRIEEEIKRIIKENYKFERREVSREEALKFFSDKREIYKVDLIENLPEDVVISLYQQGDFTDLCAGPHLPVTGMVKALKLLSIAGAYWHGDSDNKMLQRIYATSFPSKEALDGYLFKREEAKRRDHRKIGQEMELFLMHDAGPGFPFFLPKGMTLRNELESYWREQHRLAGYQEIKTPMMLSRTLWEQSGHWDHYQNNMYFTRIDEEDFAVKPMNCPGGLLVYASKPHSYKELPIRSGELGLVHRHEMSGVLHGLMRVRCFTQDDAHIFMTKEQIKDEIIGVIRMIDQFYGLFGFNYHVELSTRPEKAMGDPEIWAAAEAALANAMDELGKPYTINEGDGAFYGPKLDFHLEDCLGRTWQCGTIQLDFQMPEKFDLSYIGPDNQPHRPVMIHRVIFGSIERFIGILTEHFAGAFPLWLAPVQVKVLNITDRQTGYAEEVFKALEGAGLRAELDDRNEKIGYKIRAAQMEKVPYMLILGDKEQEAGAVSLRRRNVDLGSRELSDVISMLKKEIEEKSY